MNSTDLLKDCDCAIVTSPASLYYLSGLDQSDAVIVLTKSEWVYLTNPLYEVAVKGAVSSDLTVKVLTRMEQIDYLRAAVRQARRVGVEYDDMTLAKCRELFPAEKKPAVDLSPILAKARRVKKAHELALIKKAEGIVDETFSEVLPLLKEGVTEKEIKEEIRSRMIRLGAEGEAFDTIVAFGERAAMPHAIPSDRRLKKGDCVLMDFGAKVDGYSSDFTRTVSFGEPSARFREAYDTVLKAQLAAIEYLQSGGRKASEADAVARRIVDESPFKGRFNHTLGHGVGIEIHEAPAIAAGSADTLTEGMVFTIEPGVYLEGEFGIRIESLVSIENGLLTVIDRSDKEIIIV